MDMDKFCLVKELKQVVNILTLKAPITTAANDSLEYILILFFFF